MGTDLKPTTAPAATTPLVGTELIPCAQGGASKSTTAAAIAALAAAGPASSTDNALARFDGTTGKLLQNGLATEDDNGRVTVPTGSSGGLAFGGGTTLWYEPAVNQPALQRAGTDVLDVADVGGGVIRLRVNVSGGIQLSGAAGANQQVGAATQRFVFGGGAGVDWYAEGSGGVSAWVASASGDFTAVSRGLRAYRSVETNTAVAASPNLLASTESRRLLTNEGATAENYHTLPSAAAGMEYAFYCQDTDGIRIVANAGDTIRISGTASAAAGFVRSSSVGSALILTAINVTEWVAISVVGTWTVDA